MGTSTAGIAHAAICGHLLGPADGLRPLGSQGPRARQNRIEGRLLPGQKVVVVEDLISTGGSVIEVVEALREAGAEVLGVVSHLHLRDEKGTGKAVCGEREERFSDQLRCHLRGSGRRPATSAQADVARLKAFRDNPADESWIHR